MSDFKEDAGDCIEIEIEQYNDELLEGDCIEIEIEQYNDELLDVAEKDVDLIDCEAIAGAEKEQYTTIRQVLSLKKNCFECITKNFERFNNAYLTSEDAVLNRNLEFLQRKYSSQIIYTLRGKRMLNDRHLEFLINEHLKELDIRIFIESNCSFKAIEKRIVLVGHGFTKVSLDLPRGVRKVLALRRYISDCLNASICHFSNVEVLRIIELCNDTTLKNVSLFCTKLKELYIDGSSKITNKGLKKLCKKYGKHKTDCLIKVLSVRDTHVSGCTISYLLRNMPSLEVLNYDYLPFILHSMHKDDLKNNTLNNVKKYNLTKLDFSCACTSSFLKYHDNLEKRLLKEEMLHVFTEVCPQIKTLCIKYTNETCIDLISRFSNLENLTAVGETRNTDFNNFLKSNGIKLQSLQIGYFALSIPILIKSCPKLETLVLTDLEFQSLEDNLTQEQSSYKRSLNNLIELFLERITFSDEYAEDSVTNILLSSPHLEKLYFDRCKFGDSKMNTILAKFCKDRALLHLIFYCCDIDLALLESIILTCSSLVSLTIHYCGNIRYDDALNLLQLRDIKRSLVVIVFNIFDHEEGILYRNV